MAQSFRSTLITLIGCLSLFTFTLGQDSSGVRCRSHTPFSWDIANAVVVMGNYAYLAAGTSGLRIVNIANPLNPQEVGYYDTPGTATGITVVGNNAYIADGPKGLCIVNISDPQNPQLVSKFEITPYFTLAAGLAKDVCVDGNYAYLTGEGKGLYIINISDPTHPFQIGRYVVSSSSIVHTISSVIVNGSYAFVGCNISGVSRYENVMLVIDISNPANPRGVATCRLPYVPRKIIIPGNNMAYCAESDSGLYVVNVGNPLNPSIAGRINTQGSAYSLQLSHNLGYAFVADGDSGLSIVDLNRSSIMGRLRCTGTSLGIAISGNYTYLANGSNGLQVINTTVLTTPQGLGVYNRYGTSVALALSGNYAYVAKLDMGLRVYNISNPDSIYEVSSYSRLRRDSIYVTDVKISGHYAVIADGGYMRIIDIAIPDSVFQAGRYAATNYYTIQSVGVFGNYAFVAPVGLPFTIIDISNPDSLRVVGSVYGGTRWWNVYNITVVNGYAFLSTGFDGVHIIDISNPATPRIAGSFGTWGAYDVAVRNNTYAYVAVRDSCLRVISLVSPSSPQGVTSYFTPGTSQGICISGNYGFVADGGSGIRILNVTNPIYPYEIGFYDTPGTTNKISVNGNFIYTTDGSNFGIYDCSQALGVVDRASNAIPQNFSLKQNYPNPFNTTTTIEYSLPKTSKVELKLFDVTGREAGTLVNFSQNPGTYRVHLDASKLSSGIYFYRLRAGSYSEARKLTILK